MTARNETVAAALVAPWKIAEQPHTLSVVDSEGDVVIDFDEKDRAFWNNIIRAVNAHDDLVKALQTSLVAMSIAAGVADEYDFDPAIAECKATLSRLHSEG